MELEYTIDALQYILNEPAVGSPPMDRRGPIEQAPTT